MKLPELSEILKERKKLGLMQTELAKKANVSQSLIARIESNTVDPRYSNVAQIFRALDELKGKEIAAGEIMTKKVVGIQIGNKIEKAVKKMKQYGVSQMPVYGGDAVVGAISEEAILDQISKGVDGKILSLEPVENYMDEAFPTMSPETPLSVISALLEYNTAVMVMEKGKAKGIITKADMLKVVHG